MGGVWGYRSPLVLTEDGFSGPADPQSSGAAIVALLSGLRLSAPDTIAVAGAGASGCFITPVSSCSAPPSVILAGSWLRAGAGSGGSPFCNYKPDIAGCLSLSLIFCSPGGLSQTSAGFYSDLRQFRHIFQSSISDSTAGEM